MASDCVRPIGDALYQVMFARGDFVQSTVIEIETSHTEAVTEMLVHMATVGVHIDADGKLVSKRPGALRWDPAPLAGLTGAFADFTFAAPSAAAHGIMAVEIFTMMSKPYAAELPQAILDIIEAEPAGAVARSYRLYIVTVLMPMYRRVADIMNAHSAVVRDHASLFLMMPVQHPSL